MKRKPPPGEGKRNDPRAQGKQDGKPQSSQADANGQPKPSPSPASEEAGQQEQAQAPSPSPQPDQPADAEAQRAADAAQRERIRQALERQQGAPPEPGQRTAAPSAETPAERERRLANEAWLRRVPDDPGGLLRTKFRLEYERRQMEGGD
jgi:Ca-activated chloride channel family protein